MSFALHSPQSICPTFWLYRPIPSNGYNPAPLDRQVLCRLGRVQTMAQKERKALKTRLLQEQEGKCAVCRRSEFCSACHFGLSHGDCKVQPVNTLDHNHSHAGCNGCEQCARGVTHSICNRAITILEINEHLQNDFIKAYLARGKQSSTL